MIDVQTNPISIPSREDPTLSHHVPTQMSTDSGIFTRSQSVVDKNDSTYDCDNKVQEPNHFNENNKMLVKKTSKDSGIDCRLKTESINGESSKEFESHQSLTTSNDDGQSEKNNYSSLPDRINKITKFEVTKVPESIFEPNNNNNNTDEKSDKPIKEKNESRLQVQHTNTVDLLDECLIPSSLINRWDGLKESYFYTDENGSPKICEEMIEKERVASERKECKRKGIAGSEDVDIFGCLGFAKFSRLFKPSRKYLYKYNILFENL